MNLRQCLVLIATLWPVSAFSAAGDTFFTGDMLHRYCNQSSESCTNYIAGVVDALIAVGATQKTPLICLHDRTELGQAVDVIANYLRAHPEKRQGNAAGIAITALRHAFPCSSHQRRSALRPSRIAANITKLPELVQKRLERLAASRLAVTFSTLDNKQERQCR